MSKQTTGVSSKQNASPHTTLQKALHLLLLLGTVLAALKLIFVDYSMDEEYQIVMGYRHLMGDAWFGEMWEPHQTSSYLVTALMWIYHSLLGTYTGVVLYLRVITTLIQLGLSWWLFLVTARFLEKEEAVLIALLYFNIVPKLIQIPEFGNLQVWFWTGLTVCFLEYETHPKAAGKPLWIWLAGICMALEILSYPSAILVFPLALIYLCLRGKKDEQPKNAIRNPLRFCGACALCAAVWALLIFSQVSPDEFLRNLPRIVTFDLTHDLALPVGARLLTLLQGFGWECLLLLLSVLCSGVIFALASALSKNRRKISLPSLLTKGQLVTLLSLLTMIATLMIQFVYWAILRRGFELPQIHLFAPLLLALILRPYAGEKKKYLTFGLLSAVLTLLAVLYMSDLTFPYAVPHAMLGSLFGIILAAMALREQFGSSGSALIRLLLICFVLLCIFGKGFTLRGGRGNDITQVAGIMKHGPAACVLGDYMCAYIYNSNYEDFRNTIPQDAKVLIVTNMVFSPGTTPYMFTDAEICHFSIVDPTSYDERLLTYWEDYPEKQPDVIVVDCWYGQLMEDPDNWIMQYIENDFGYTEVRDGKYVRFYL